MKLFLAISTVNLLLAMPMLVHAVNHVVMVGANNQFAYSPNTLTAAAGDTIEFDFIVSVSV